MKTALEDIGPVKRKLLVEIEAGEVDKKLNEAYMALGRKAKIPGFRPGKAPRTILERHFANQVVENVTRDLINETFPKAMEEAGVFPLGMPLLEKEVLKKGSSFRYSAVMEVRPVFEVKDYLGVEVEKEKWSVTDEDVDSRLEQIRRANGKLSPLEEDRGVRMDDYVVIDYEAFGGDQPLEGVRSQNFLLQVGSNDFHTAFEEALVGSKKGDEKEITVDFEETHQHPKLAGKSVRFRAKIVDIKEMVLPELNDEFAQSLASDFEGLEDLKNKLKEAITTEEEKRVDRGLKDRLMEKVSQGIDFELPEVLVESELNYAVQNVKQNLTRSGSNLEKAGISEQKLKAELEPASRKRVKETLILSKIADLEQISVDEEELNEGCKKLGASTGQDAEAIRKYYEGRNLVDSLRQTLLEEKALNYLVEHARINEVEKGTLSQNNIFEKGEP
jgi:trigger factor